MIRNRLVAITATTAMALALATHAQAQQIAGGISGKITDASGHGLGGVQVTITYQPTHVTVNTTTSPDGFYNVSQLQPGGPYQVHATDNGFTDQTLDVPSIPVGDAYELNLSLQPVGAAVGEVVVTASRVGSSTVQTGPRSVFSQAQIQAQPSFNRDLKDTARLNPFVTLDPTNSNALLIAGNNNHTNTIYVDGERQNDIFGLNGNGYPTQRSPLPLEAVKEFSVEVAPYDVQYGDFQGGVLNIVTQNGTNEFHGGGYYQYDSNELGAGEKVGASGLRQPDCTNGAFSGTGCGGRYVKPTFKDKEYGIDLGGPIIPDRVFFFFDYDHYETTNTSSYVPSDVAGSNPVTGVTSANVNAITSALKNIYNYDPGTYGAAAPVQNTDYFGRLDFNITNNQHLFLSYQRTDGTTLNEPDENVNNDLGLSSTFYIYEQLLQQETADLQSHWTDKLSTEIEYIHQTVDSPSTLNSPLFSQFQIDLPNSSASYVRLGTDISRQANDLSTAENLFKAKANYTLGSHVLTVGYEYDNVKESDLFVQNAAGSYTFSNACGPGIGQANGAIINLQAQVACGFTYANAYDNNPATAGGAATFNTHTAYIQDQWTPISGLRLRGGLRLDYYQAPDKPLYNPTFQQEYGFANNLTIDGEYVVQPRLGFNWKPESISGLTVYGGAGLFAGGTPGVYLYDSYDNPGNLIGTIVANCSTATCTSPLLNNVSGKSIPTAGQTAVTANANAGLGITNSLDPNFHPPADWKASVGLIKTFDLGRYGGDGWRFHLDYLYQKTQYAVNWVDLFEEANTLSTTAPDGRPEFNPARYTTPIAGTNQTRSTGYDIELTNTDKGFGHVVAVGLGKSFPFGLDIDYTFTYQHVEDISPATSSVALSNYSQNATADPNHPGLAVSNYEIPWENKLSITYRHKFFGNANTIASLFLQYRAGLPYSYTFYSAASSSTPADNLFGQTGAAAYRSDQLLYVPKADSSGNVTATSDPVVKYGSSFNVAQFNTFLHQSGLIKYAGEIAPRNAFNSAPVTTADIHIEQEIPTFFPRTGTLSAYLNIINVANLINNNWGLIYQTGFPYFLSPVQAKNCQAVMKNACASGVGNFYEYDTLRSTSQTLQNGYQPPIPTWAIQLGLRFKF